MKKIEITLTDEGLLETVAIDGRKFFDKADNFNENTGNVLKIKFADFIGITSPISIKKTLVKD